MAKKCSLNAAAGSDCGSSRGLEEFTKLNNCIDDITAHLAKCHLSKENISEKNLILVRAGLHCLGEKNIEGMTVCPKHRHAFGKFWRPPTTCQYPEHAGKTTAIAGTHVINLKVAEEIRAIFGQIIPAGSRKYNLFPAIFVYLEY
jgi:hypothetical protein